MDFKDLIRVIRRRWMTITALFLLSVTVSGAISFGTPAMYESRAKIFIAADAQNFSDAYAASFFVPARVQSYAQLATHREVLQGVNDELGLDYSIGKLSSRITGTVEPETVIVVITAQDENPERAQQLARAESEQLVAYLVEVETPEGGSTSQIKPTITDPATFSDEPVSPRVMLNLIIGALIGLILGATVALVRDLLDNTIKSNEDVEEVTKTAVMASVGVDRSMLKQPLLTDVDGFSPRGEAFRMLRTNLQYLDLDKQPRSLVITSAVAGEGKTTTSTNLAVALAQAGRRVLLIDGDLRRPRVAALLGLESRIGLTTVLVGRTSLEESVQHHAATGVHFLAGGPTPPNPTEILQSHAARELLARLRDSYDAVIIDAPPLLPVADAAILGTVTDGVILVTRYGKTHRDEVSLAAERIQKVGGRLYGVVMNMVPRAAKESYYYYYYEGQEPGGARRKLSSDA